MTGKHCIFCPQETVFEDGSEGKVRDSVFVIMPFRWNLDTFYEWRLKPFLAANGIDKERIKRADEFSRTGYVMCEKTCLRIQQAALVVVDLSVVNANVYYELGIAIGLNKPILAVAEKETWNSTSEQFCKATGLDPNLVLPYTNVGSLERELKRELAEYAFRVPLGQRNAKTRVVAVLVRDKPSPVAGPSGGSETERQKNDDIQVSFQEAIKAAVEVAVGMLREKTDSRELKGIFSTLNEEIKELADCKHMHLTNESHSPQQFDQIAPHLDSALIAIIDLAQEDPLAYFWLGYCHGRNINVIPIYRGNPASENVLAFDIRALWYMDHKPKETKQLATKLAAVLEPILIRDVNTQQRRVFWERITRRGRVHIYNGAVHYRELNREVVGDWDLRTASELISYLSSTDESVVPVLQSPIYSPETIAEKLQKEVNREFISTYVELVKQELSGKNCVIVASADVNPITEIVLAYSYEPAGMQVVSPPASFSNEAQKNDDVTVIAIKSPARITSSAENESAAEVTKVNGPAQAALPLRFARTMADLGKQRGFLIDGKPRVLDYLSQDDPDARCSILAHLAIVRNPFTPKDNIIVILNGVSGPATFGLAEALTGGADGSKAQASEILLKTINKVWSSAMNGSERRHNGVEAILQVNIEPPHGEHAESGANDTSAHGKSRALATSIKNKFYDMREVARWSFYVPDGSPIRTGNPRPFP